MKLNVKEAIKDIQLDPLFIRKAPNDKSAAAVRLASTESHFEAWHSEINRTNTRGLPAELIALYDEAAVAMCKILTYERDIVTGAK